MTAASHKQRMLAGELYSGQDPELVADQLRARSILDRFNASLAGEDAVRRALLAELFAALGEGAVARLPFGRDHGSNIRIGRRTFPNFGRVVLACSTVSIGDDVQIGPAEHPLDAATRRCGDTVGGAGSVVVRDLPPGVVAVGNPCRVLRPLPGCRPAHHSP